MVAPAESRQDIGELARKIEDRLREPLLLAGQPMTISASVGFSVFPEDGHTAQTLVQRADEAMYRMKRARIDAQASDGDELAKN